MFSGLMTGSNHTLEQEWTSYSHLFFNAVEGG